MNIFNVLQNYVLYNKFILTMVFYDLFVSGRPLKPCAQS